MCRPARSICKRKKSSNVTRKRPVHNITMAASKKHTYSVKWITTILVLCGLSVMTGMSFSRMLPSMRELGISVTFADYGVHLLNDVAKATVGSNASSEATLMYKQVASALGREEKKVVVKETPLTSSLVWLMSFPNSVSRAPLHHNLCLVSLSSINLTQYYCTYSSQRVNQGLSIIYNKSQNARSRAITLTKYKKMPTK